MVGIMATAAPLAFQVSLTVDDPEGALAFYQQAFAAEVVRVIRDPAGAIMHCDLIVGDSPVYLSGEMEVWGAISPLKLGGAPACLCLLTKDCDAVFERAVAAGAEIVVPMGDQCWGERMGMVRDPFGYRWSIAHTIKELTEAEIHEVMSGASKE